MGEICTALTTAEQRRRSFLWILSLGIPPGGDVGGSGWIGRLEPRLGRGLLRVGRLVKSRVASRPRLLYT